MQAGTVWITGEADVSRACHELYHGRGDDGVAPERERQTGLCRPPLHSAIRQLGPPSAAAPRRHCRSRRRGEPNEDPNYISQPRCQQPR